MKKMQFRYLLAILIMSLLTVSIWFRNGHQLGTAEGGLPFNNLERHAQIFRWAWADGATGTATGILVAAFPTYSLLSVFEKLGTPPFITEALVFWIMLATAGIGVFLIANRITGMSEGFSLLAVIFYWTSPFILVNVWNRFLYNHIFFIALFPLVIYFFTRGLMQRRFYYSLLAALMILLYSYALTAVALTVLIFGVVFFITLYLSLFSKNWQEIKFNLFYLAGFILCFVLTNFWWISQLIAFTNSANYLQSVASFFTSQGNLEGLTTLSNLLGNFNDITRFMHHSFYYGNSSIWASIYIGKPGLVINSVILGLILSGIYFSRKNKIMLMFSLFFLISVFLSKGNSPPFGELFTAVFLQVPALQIFRNPFEKIALLTVLSGALLFSFALEKIHLRFLSRLYSKFLSGRNYTVIISALFIAVFWGFPFFSGLIFTYYKNPFGVIGNYEVEVPDYYREADAALKNDPDAYRFLALPILGEGITHNWDVPYTGVDLYSTLFSKQNISLNTTIPYYQQVLTHLVGVQLSPKLFSFLPFLGVDEILLRRDIDFKERAFPDPAVSERFLNSMEQSGYIQKTENYGPLTKYELRDDLKWGKFYISNNIVFSDEKNFSYLVSDPENLKNKPVYIPVDYADQLDDINASMILFPNSINKYEQIPIYYKMSTEELISRLFYVRHDPDNIIYPLVRSKELLTSMLYFEYPEWVLFNTNLLGKRVVEICRSSEQGAGPDVINNIVSDYMSDFYGLRNDIENLVVTDKRNKKEVLESLSAQAVLLSRCSEIPFSIFHELFVKLKMIPYPWTNETLKKEWIEAEYNVPYSGNYHISEFPTAEASLLDGHKNEVGTVSNNDASTLLNHDEISLLFEEDTIYSKQNVFFREKIDLSDKDFTVTLPINDYEEEYEIEFEYQTLKGDFFGYYVTQDNNHLNSPNLFGGVMLSSNRSKHKKIISPSIGSTKMTFGFTGDKNKFCIHQCIRHENKLEARLFNLNITRRKLRKPYFSAGTAPLTSGSSVLWKRNSPVSYSIEVSKKSDTPEFLVFSELFSGGWTVYDGQGNKLDDKLHYLVNGYANGWLLRKSGDFAFTVYYQPNEWLKYGYIISAIASLITIFSIIKLIRKSDSAEKND